MKVHPPFPRSRRTAISLLCNSPEYHRTTSAALALRRPVVQRNCVAGGGLARAGIQLILLSMSEALELTRRDLRFQLASRELREAFDAHGRN